MRTRWDRGVALAKAGRQVRRVSETVCLVKSQTVPGLEYTLTRTVHGWDCTCPDGEPFCKHVWALEHLAGDRGRAERGLSLYRAGQVQVVGEGDYRVKSRRSDFLYEVKKFSFGWACSCPDHLETLAECKHIQAVQFECGERHVIERQDGSACWSCDSRNVIGRGSRSGRRRLECKDCGRMSTDDPAFSRMRTDPSHVMVGIEMFFAGLSSRKTATALTNAGCPVKHSTIQRWGRRFGRMMEQYLDLVRPHLGEMWRTDELYLRIRGDRKYLFAMLDAKTRYWIARQVATHKGTDDVCPMFRKAKEVAGKVPSLLISDGASNFAEAHGREYAPRNFLWKDSRHESHIRMDGDLNNNQMESFNGNTLRFREKVTRGLKKEDSAILAGLQVYHNHVRPHLALGGGTPGEAAGIHIEGGNPWRSIIESAARFEARLKANPPD